VEILLTSNDVILGVKGKEHPLKTYIRYGVPVVLATDDEGVSRSEMTREYQRAVMDQELGYLQLKRMARNSLAYAFIEGASLWKDRKYTQTVAACAKDKPAANRISVSSASFLPRMARRVFSGISKRILPILRPKRQSGMPSFYGAVQGNKWIESLIFMD
jgi:hypothetical protein